MARRQINAPKIVADPLYGIIDIRPVLPMIETEEFQALGDKRQLGMSYITFPSATHTRKSHSLGSYHATRGLADRWLDFGLVSEAEADALSGYALYHDIGHPAFSHVTEDLCELDNDGLGLRIVKRLKDKIEACGIDYPLLQKLAEHENPLYLAVHDKNLGMEKLDYLERDGLYTILARPAGIEYLRRHIYFIKGELTIDEKVIDNAVEAQNFYMKMYKNVYLRKASAIAQRMMQKMVYRLIIKGEISPNDLPRLSDSELIGFIYFSKDKLVNEFYRLLKIRDLFRETIAIRPEGFADHDSNDEKPVALFGIPRQEMSRLVKSPNLNQKKPAALGELENKIAALADIPEEAVLVVPIFNPERFAAKDIKIYRKNGATESLKDRLPAHFKNMEEVARSYLALRVCTLEKYRKNLSAPSVAKNVADLITKIG